MADKKPVKKRSKVPNPKGSCVPPLAFGASGRKPIMSNYRMTDSK